MVALTGWVKFEVLLQVGMPEVSLLMLLEMELWSPEKAILLPLHPHLPQHRSPGSPL